MMKDQRDLCGLCEKECSEAIIRITGSLGAHGDRSDALHRALCAMPEAMWAHVPASAELRIDDPASSGGLLRVDETGCVFIDLKILMERFWNERLSEDLADLADVFAMDIDDALAMLDPKDDALGESLMEDGGVLEQVGITGGGFFEIDGGTLQVSTYDDGTWHVDMYLQDAADDAVSGDVGTFDVELAVASDGCPGVIGELAFAGCDGIATVDLPASTREIQFCAFAACGDLSRVDLPDGLTSVYPGAFAYSGMTDVSWPRSCTTVPAHAFAGCERLRHVELPEGVHSIESNAFAGCTGLRTVDIPASCTKIALDAFDKGVELRRRG